MSSIFGLSPVITFDGRQYVGTGDFDNLTLRHGDVEFGGGDFSVAFTARWDTFRRWGCIVDFGDGRGDANIFIGNKASTGTFVFMIQVDSEEITLEVPNLIALGETNRYLCTISATVGCMQVLRDGVTVGRRAGVPAPPRGRRKFLYVAKSSWENRESFHGLIANLVVWNALVDWAGRAVPPGGEGACGGGCVLRSSTPPPRTSSARADSQDKRPLGLESPVPLALRSPPGSRSPQQLSDFDRLPLLRYSGREFQGALGDFENLSTSSSVPRLGGAFSVAFTARWDSFNKWSRIIDFGNGKEDENIFIGNKGTGGTFVFHIWVGAREYRLHIPDVIALGETHRYLCTVSAGGQMRVYCDGSLIGEKLSGAVAPRVGKRLQMLVGRSNWDRDGPFHGMIRDLALWNSCLDWDSMVEVKQGGELATFRGKVLLVDVQDGQSASDEFEGRAWLEHHLKACLPLGWALKLQSSGVSLEDEEGESSITVMQFASKDTVLLLRIHQGRALPSCVFDVLTSDRLRKATFGFDRDMQAGLESALGVQPAGVVDLALVAYQRGHMENDLESLASRFGFTVPERPSLDQDWSRDTLSPDQIQSAADAAFLSLLLLDRLWSLPAVEKPKSTGGAPTRVTPLVVLSLEWKKHGIEQREDGCWCGPCAKGPFKGQETVENHIISQKHVRKVEQLEAQGKPVPEEFARQGIEREGSSLYRCGLCNAGPFSGDAVVVAHIGSKKHQKAMVASKPLPAEYAAQHITAGVDVTGTACYKCTLCSAGPFHSVGEVDGHVQSKKHQKAMSQGVDFEIDFPDYVEALDGVFICNLCDVKTPALPQLLLHLGGDRHAKRCRAQGKEEIFFDTDKQQLVKKATRTPLSRPRPEVVEAAKVEAPPVAVNQPSQPAGLPPGWQKVWHAESGQHYFADLEGQTAQWEPPKAYVHGDWSRSVDPHGRAFWESFALQISFYELDDSGVWARRIDADGRPYWSNPSMQVRFFEDGGSTTVFAVQ